VTAAMAAGSPAVDKPNLRLDGISVRFGGIHAVESLSLDAAAGMITGLIGPNGAGKTTTFNACTGFVKPSSGSVYLGESRIDGASPAKRAKLGLGRTFQRMELWDTLTVRENVALGREALLSGRRPWGQLYGTRRERRAVLDAAEAALDRCGIAAVADTVAGDISTGQARLVELARAVASGFEFLLLDEPSSGLDVAETEQFGQVLVDLADGDGIGILLVEHDMALVRRVCRYLYVLDFGRLLTHGPAEEVLASDVVRAAYLGSEEVDG
jgi:ABC-type branched-subunit amino acid transport system ATPase component